MDEKYADVGEWDWPTQQYVDLTEDDQPEVIELSDGDDDVEMEDVEKPKKGDCQCRDWIFTIHKPDDATYAALKRLTKAKACTYMRYQGEKTEKDGPHLQGCMQWSIRKKHSWLMSKLHFSYLAPRAKNATAQEMADYICDDEPPMKGGKKNPKAGQKKYFPEVCERFEYGVLDTSYSCGQGERSDLDEVGDEIKKGKSFGDICLTNTNTAIKYHAGIKAVISALRDAPDREGDLAVYCLFGDSTCGKTTWAMEECKRMGWGEPLEICPDLSDIGQAAQADPKATALLVEEFTGGMQLQHMKLMLDPMKRKSFLRQRYFNVKNNFKALFLTSNHDPWTWYSTENQEDVYAMYRRFTCIKEFRGIIDVDEPNNGVTIKDHPIAMIKPGKFKKGLPDWWIMPEEGSAERKRIARLTHLGGLRVC